MTTSPASWHANLSAQLGASGYQLGWKAVRYAPEPVAYALFDRLADHVWWRDGKGVRQLRANLAQVMGADPNQPQVDALAREAMRSYLRYWCDVFRLPSWDAQRITTSVEVVGGHHVQAWQAAGTAFVGALPHMGNWDHVGAFAAGQGFPIVTVAERLKPQSLFDRFVAVRRELGIEVVALGGPNVLGALKQGAAQGRSVCLLADRDLPRSGVPVRFFDEPASMPPGPALLAIFTGLPLHPVSTSYAYPEGAPARPGQHRLRVQIHDPIAVPEHGTTREKVAVMTQQMAQVFATAIAAQPADWHMLQRLWPAIGPAAPRVHRPGAALELAP